MARILLETRRFYVERREYHREFRDPAIRDVVVHPGAVVILPILDEGRILLIRQYRHAVEKELLELPAGTVEPDEPPIDTARRELIEETGYEAASMEPLLEFYTSPGVLTETMFAYVAGDLRWVGQQLGPTERIQVEPMAQDEIRRRLLEGTIRDGKTIAALATYFLRQR